MEIYLPVENHHKEWDEMYRILSIYNGFDDVFCIPEYRQRANFLGTAGIGMEGSIYRQQDVLYGEFFQ